MCRQLSDFHRHVSIFLLNRRVTDCNAAHDRHNRIIACQPCHEMPAPPRPMKIKRKPARGTLVRYEDRIVEVLGEARGQRVMIRSIHPDGQERRTAVKWVNLIPLETQLF